MAQSTLSRIRVSLSHSPPSLVTAMAAGFFFFSSSDAPVMETAKLELQRLRFISGVVVFAAMEMEVVVAATQVALADALRRRFAVVVCGAGAGAMVRCRSAFLL